MFNFPNPSQLQILTILRSKAPSRGLWMPELVLYDIRQLAKQLLGTVLDIEVDQSTFSSVLPSVVPDYRVANSQLSYAIKAHNAPCSGRCFRCVFMA